MSWIKSADIRTGAVTGPKLAANAVGTTTIAANAVGYGQLDISVEQTAIVSISNAEMLALRATPKVILASTIAGAGKAIILERAVYECLNSVAYTGPQNLALKYTDGAGASVCTNITGAGLVDQTTQQYRSVNNVAGVVTPNAALVLHNIGAGELGAGNAANVNRIRVYYRVVTL